MTEAEAAEPTKDEKMEEAQAMGRRVNKMGLAAFSRGYEVLLYYRNPKPVNVQNHEIRGSASVMPECGRGSPDRQA